MKKLDEVVSRVKSEIDSIRKRDGELPKTPYLVIEIASRLKTLTDWEGKDPKKKQAQAIREIVEKCIANPKYKAPVEVKELSMVEEEDDHFLIHGELDVDWEEAKTVYRFTNSLDAPRENMSRQARRNHKKKLNQKYQKVG